MPVRSAVPGMVPSRLTFAFAAMAMLGVAAPIPTAQQSPTFKSSLSTVNVFATVRTRDRKIVRDLERQDFDLRVDGKPREITVFSREAQPVTIAMILDTSGSVEAVDREKMSVAARAFLGFMSTGDRLSLGTLFYDCVPFTDNRNTLLGMLREDLPQDLGSPVWNAASRVIGSLETASTRRAVLLFSDGGDNGGALLKNAPRLPADNNPFNLCSFVPGLKDLSVGTVRTHAIRASTMVYSVGIDDRTPQSSLGLGNLANLSDDTGGGHYRLDNLDDLRKTFVEIAEELHLQYSLGFTETEYDGKRHDIRLRVKRDGVNVRARRSFVGTAASASAPAQAATPRTSRDVPYGDHVFQKLDLFTPATKGFPTVVFVHGGSLTGGDKTDSDYGKVCDAFPAAGIGCVNINYRLLPAASWPAPAQDVAAALAWLRAHIAESGGDPDRLFLLGHSSGAMLVALVGADASLLAAHQLTSSAVRGVMPMGSIMWDDDQRQAIATNGRDTVDAAFARDPRGRAFGSLSRYDSQWPINYVRQGMPPYLFLIAESEQVNPPVLKTNQQFVDDARAKGNQADLKVFAGRTHYSMIRRISEPGDEVFSVVSDFLRK